MGAFHQSSESDSAGRFQTARVALVSFGHGIHDTYTAFLPPLLPIFIVSLSMSRAEAGVLALFTQVPSVLNPLIGHAADRSRWNHLVFLAPAVTALTMSLLGEAPNYAFLVVLLLIAGLSTAVFHAVGPVITGRISGNRLGQGMSVWMFGGELGRALGPLVVVTAIQYFTIGGLPWLMAPGVVVALLLTVWFRDNGGHVHQERADMPWRQALVRMRPVLLPVVGLIVTRAFMFGALTIYLPTFLSEQGSSLWLAGAALTVVQTAGAVGAFLGGTLSDRLGRRTVLFFGMLLTPVLMLVFLNTGGWIRFPLLMLMGLTLISTTPVIMALVQENCPESRALANGMYLSLSFSIRSVLIVAVGGLGDLFGLHTAYLISAAVMLAGLPIVFFLPRDKSRQPAPRYLDG